MVRPTKNLPVAVPGARGAYSQLAARRFFGDHRPALSCGSAAEAVRALSEGRASHAVLPVENSITGAFAGVAEAFFEGEIAVVGEVLLPIRHCVLGNPGARLEDLSVITGHASSIAQCRDWIASWGFATRVSNDTGEAARELAASGDPALGVLGSRELAHTYALEVLAEGVSDRPDNRTRFLVLAERGSRAEQGARHALQVGPVTTPRALKTLRIQLESLGASRVRVPFLGSEDGTRFLVEFDQPDWGGERAASRACGNLPHRYLGAWTPGKAYTNGSQA
jgi:prephenate dehydratase